MNLMGLSTDAIWFWGGDHLGPAWNESRQADVNREKEFGGEGGIRTLGTALNRTAI